MNIGGVRVTAASVGGSGDPLTTKLHVLSQFSRYRLVAGLFVAVRLRIILCTWSMSVDLRKLKRNTLCFETGCFGRISWEEWCQRASQEECKSASFR